MPGLHKVPLTLPSSNVGDVYVARRARGTDMEARVQATPAQKTRISHLHLQENYHK